MSSQELAWPDAHPAGGGPASRLPGVATAGDQEVVAATVCPTPGRAGPLLALTSYPAYNDRRFDAWLFGPDGSRTRVGRFVLGFDVRPDPPAAP